MATIDASGLSFSFDAFDSNAVNFTASPGFTPLSLTWQSSSLHRITALGTGITAEGASGTVSAVMIQSDGYGAGLAISGLNASLPGLIDVSNGLLNQAAFWNSVMAGASTILLPANGVALQIMGDILTVGTGVTFTGSADRFEGTGFIAGAGRLIGDAVLVLAGGSLTGGADVFINSFTSELVGDVGLLITAANLGFVRGGADTFTLTGIPGLPIPGPTLLVGDVTSMGDGSTTIGGADTISLTDLGPMGLVTGDLYLGTGALTGGADTITLRTTVAGPVMLQTASIAGDAHEMGGAVSGTSTLTGGADRITLTNANTGALNGDVGTLAGATLTGGADVITASGTFAEGTSLDPPPFPITPNVGAVTGDAFVISNMGQSVSGGDDTITLTNVATSIVSGDAYTASLATGNFTGGDDLIRYTFNRQFTPPLATSSLFGDVVALSMGSGAAVMGDDVITADLRGGVVFPAAAYLFGDTQSLSITGGAVTMGDDTLTLFSNNPLAPFSTLIGDGEVGGTPTQVIWGNDTLRGSVGADLLIGDAVNGLTIAGQSGGADILDGQGGNDTLFGGFGNDTALFSSLDLAVTVFLDGLPGSNPADPVHAIGQGFDRLTGIENIVGSGRADLIVGSADGNNLKGAAGNDVLAGLAGADRLDGGTGTNDTADYSASASGVTIRLWNGTGVGGDAQGDILTGIETVIGSALADGLAGSAAANTLTGGAGNDVLSGLAGADRLVGGDGLGDTADYSASASGVTVRLFTGTGLNGDAQGDVLVGIENLTGSALADGLIGADTAANRLRGGAGNDYLNGLSGIDRLEGEAGADILVGGAGADVLIGGTEVDTADYSGSVSGVTVRLYNGTGLNGDAAGDVLSGIENVTGSGQGDGLVGADGTANRLRGGAGNDFLNGLSGGDRLEGEAGNDILIGGSGADVLIGGTEADTADYSGSVSGVTVRLFNGTGLNGDAAGDTLSGIEKVIGSALADGLAGSDGNDTLDGGAGNDFLTGRAGADRLDGGAGSGDIADYSGSVSGVTVRLFNGTGLNGDAQGDVLAGIEHLTGSGAGDGLVGSDGVVNRLAGGAGNDFLDGRTGNDTLDGGAGNDTLAELAGAGADTFVFAAGYGQDRVSLFENGSDKVDLVGLTFAQLTETAVAGGVRLAITAAPTTFIELLGVTTAQIDAGDFI